MMLINGRLGDEISVLDRGLQYGDGVFETIAIKNSQLLLWELHWQRLELGCRRLEIAIPDRHKLEDEATRLVSGVEKGILKVIITRGVGSRGYKPTSDEPSRIVYTTPWPDFRANHRTDGVSLRQCDLRLSRQPRLAGIKHLNRLENVLARAEWSDEQFADGLLLDDADNVIETTSANVFAVIDHALVTPQLNDCGIAGVLRAKIVELARQNYLKVIESNLSMKQLNDARELFICNSVIGIWPVSRVEGRHWNTSEYNITRNIQRWIEPFIVNEETIV